LDSSSFAKNVPVVDSLLGRHLDGVIRADAQLRRKDIEQKKKRLSPCTEPGKSKALLVVSLISGPVEKQHKTDRTEKTRGASRGYK
jgi:hypothetical protein